MNSSEPFVYYGTSNFSAAILQGLLDAGLTPSLVISALPKPAGRGLTTSPAPVTVLAQLHQLRVLEVQNLKSKDIVEQLATMAAPFAILAALGKIIPQSVLELYPKGIINVHPSLLPAYRGPSPIQSAIRDGGAETAVSLILLDAEIDHGPLLAQATEHIAATDDAVSLAAKLAHTAVALLLKTLPLYLSGDVQPAPQDHSRASFTTMVERSDGQADFSLSAETLDRQRRAFTPWPGLWTTWHDKRLKFINTSVTKTHRGLIGVVEAQGDNVVIGCGHDGLIVHRLKLEGGRELTATDFVRGHKDFIGSTLTTP